MAPRLTGFAAARLGQVPETLQLTRLVEIATPNFQRFDLKRCHNETKFSLLQVLIALKAHDDEKASLPAALEDLVPQYLERIPEDRFDGAPLRYSRERAVVYSHRSV